MTRIELAEDYAQPARVTVGHTLLRIAIGAILIAHGVQRLLTFGLLQDELAVQFALLEPTTPAQVLIGIELAGGFGLVLGWFTRVSALGLIASISVSVALELTHGVPQNLHVFELPTLLGISGMYFLLAGGGPVSLDEWLHARRRRKAIQNDETWLKHPYVPLPEDARSAGYPRYAFEESYDHEPQSYDHERSYDREKSYGRESESSDRESYDREQTYGREPESNGRHAYDREPAERDADEALEERPNPRYAGTKRR